MKMGVKEFRERFSELTEGSEPILVTKNGRIVGRFLPHHAKLAKDVDLEAWAARLEDWRDEWKANTSDWRERLASYGLDDDGEPLR